MRLSSNDYPQVFSVSMGRSVDTGKHCMYPGQRAWWLVKSDVLYTMNGPSFKVFHSDPPKRVDYSIVTWSRDYDEYEAYCVCRCNPYLETTDECKWGATHRIGSQRLLDKKIVTVVLYEWRIPGEGEPGT